MKKAEALRAIAHLAEYVEQFKCYELFPPKNDEPYQNLACKWLNHLHEKTKDQVEWASYQIQKDFLNGTPTSEEFLDLYRKAKSDLQEIATAAGWVAGLPCKRD